MLWCAVTLCGMSYLVVLANGALTVWNVTASWSGIVVLIGVFAFGWLAATEIEEANRQAVKPSVGYH